MKWLEVLLKKHGVSEDIIKNIQDDTKDMEYVEKSELDSLNNTITTLKKNQKNYEKLEQDYNKLNTDYTNLSNKIEKDEKISQVLKHLPNLNEQYKEDALNKIDFEKIVKQKDGSFDEKIIKELTNPVIENYKAYFTPVLEGKEPNNNGESKITDENKDLENTILNGLRGGM